MVMHIKRGGLGSETGDGDEMEKGKGKGPRRLSRLGWGRSVISCSCTRDERGEGGGVNVHTDRGERGVSQWEVRSKLYRPYKWMERRERMFEHARTQ